MQFLRTMILATALLASAPGMQAQGQLPGSQPLLLDQARPPAAEGLLRPEIRRDLVNPPLERTVPWSGLPRRLDAIVIPGEELLKERPLRPIPGLELAISSEPAALVDADQLHFFIDITVEQNDIKIDRVGIGQGAAKSYGLHPDQFRLGTYAADGNQTAEAEIRTFSPRYMRIYGEEIRVNVTTRRQGNKVINAEKMINAEAMRQKLGEGLSAGGRASTKIGVDRAASPDLQSAAGADGAIAAPARRNPGELQRLGIVLTAKPNDQLLTIVPGQISAALGADGTVAAAQLGSPPFKEEWRILDRVTQRFFLPFSSRVTIVRATWPGAKTGAVQDVSAIIGSFCSAEPGRCR